MPVSKKRKKKGKPVQRRGEDRTTGVTLQDLINVVAYQEYVKDGIIAKDGIIVALDVEINIEDEIPVTIGEGDDKREVGTANAIDGDPNRLSVHITDEEVLTQVRGPLARFSIEKEESEDV